jgi:hypothetical protein
MQAQPTGAAVRMQATGRLAARIYGSRAGAAAGASAAGAGAADLATTCMCAAPMWEAWRGAATAGPERQLCTRKAQAEGAGCERRAGLMGFASLQHLRAGAMRRHLRAPCMHTAWLAAPAMACARGIKPPLA